MALAGIKFDTDSDGFVSNSFPVRGLLKRDVQEGLRVSMLFSACFLALGFGLRCVTTDPTTATLLTNVGQVLIGIGGSVPFNGVSLLAATWFPTRQRATATAIASVFAYIGVALSFIDRWLYRSLPRWRTPVLLQTGRHLTSSTLQMLWISASREMAS